MKAMLWTAYGGPDVLKLGDLPQPKPQAGDVLVKVHTSSVTMGDCEMRSLTFPWWLRFPLRLYAGWRKPSRLRVLGQELAGEVVELGEGVERFQVGDAIFGATGFGMGGYAEYACLPEKSADGVIGRVPDGLTFEQAVGVSVGGLEALHFLNEAELRPGESVLINGAGGSIGTMAIQLAKHRGATISAVDHTSKLDMLRELGATEVIDYTREDFTQLGRAYDIIFDVVGKSDYRRSLAALNPGGRYIIANPKLNHFFRRMWTQATSDERVIVQPSSRGDAAFAELSALVAQGVLTPIVDKVYALADTAEAHRYVDSGQKKGNVVIQLIAE